MFSGRGRAETQRKLHVAQHGRPECRPAHALVDDRKKPSGVLWAACDPVTPRASVRPVNATLGDRIRTTTWRTPGVDRAVKNESPRIPGKRDRRHAEGHKRVPDDPDFAIPLAGRAPRC